MIRTRLAPLALTALAVALPSGCATTLAIRSLQPARVVLGSTDHLVILDGRGRRTAREFVAHELARQARGDGYFSVTDRSEEGAEVRVAGRRVVLEGAAPLPSGTAGLRIDVLEWNASRDIERVEEVAEDRTVTYVDVPVQHGHVLLAVTLFDEHCQTYLAETEYPGEFRTRDMLMAREEVIENAARLALRCFLGDVTPRQVVSRVRLDEDDPGQEVILATAKAGNLAQAAQDMQRYLGQQPNNAIAAFNLAVFLEAMGQFPEALAMYDHALSLGGKAYYVTARAHCARRVASYEALQD